MAITFKVGFQVDDKQLKQGLAGIQQDIQNAFNIKGGMSSEIQNATKEAMALEKALKRATTDKGISYYSLQSELNKAGTSAERLVTTLTLGGDKFKASLNAANTALATADRSVISLNSKIKEMARVTVQSFKFTAAQTMIQGITNAVREAYQWVEELNKAITDIGVVTGKTASELDLVTQSAIKGAKELRIAAADYAEGQLIFYQQGLNDKEVQRRTEITVKAAAAANQSMKDMSSQLTAIWNTYQMAADEQARAASVGAKMAADTAVDFADIATAMQVAAAPAAQMGVSYNSLAAIIATVGDTTQQSASVIGNAFKTIFSRFQQLKSEGTDGEITLNRVSSQLQELGVNVLDSAGELRQLDDVIHEVGEQWDSWSSKQQLAIAQLVGGTRQYGQFLALMQNYSKYQDLLQSANLEDGSALESQYEASLQSIESYALNAGEAWNRAFGEALDEDLIKDFLSVVEDAGKVFEGLVEGVDGIKGGLLIVAGIFARQIIPATGRALTNIKEFATTITSSGRKKNIETQYANLERANANQLKGAVTPKQKQDIKLQGQKIKNDRQIALINEDINTKLKTATGTYKIQLEYQSQQIKNEQQKLQLLSDQALEIQRQADALTESQAFKATKAEGKNGNLTEEELDTKIADAQTLKLMMDSDVSAYQESLSKVRQKLATAKPNSSREAELKKQELNLTKQLTGALKAQAAAQKEVDNLQAKRKQFISNKEIVEAKNLNKSLNEIASSLMKTTTEGTDLKTTLQSVVGGSIVEIDKLGNQLDQVGKDELEDLKQSFKNWGTATDQEIIDLIQKVKELATAIQGTDDSVEILDAAIQNAESTSTSRKNIKNTGDSTNPQAGLTPLDRSEQTKQSLAMMGQGLLQVAGAATMAYGALSMMYNVFSDENAGAVEKVMALVSALTMIAPAVKMGITGFKTYSAAISKIPVVASLAGKAVTKFGISAAAASAAATAGVTLLIGAVVFLISKIPDLIDYFHSLTLEGQLEEARENLEGLQSNLESVKSKAEEVKSAFSGYDSVVAELRSCTTGTQEWAEAVQAVNEKVLELLTLFPSLAPYISRDEYGILGIDKEGIDQVIEYQNALALAMQAATYEGKKHESELEAQQSKETYDEELNNAVRILELLDGLMIQPEDGVSFENLTSRGDNPFEWNSAQILDDAGKIFEGYEEEISKMLTSADLEAFMKRRFEELGYMVIDGIEDIPFTENEEGEKFVSGDNQYISSQKLSEQADIIFDKIVPSAQRWAKAVDETETEANAFNDAIGAMIIAGENYNKETADSAGRLYEKSVEEARKKIDETYASKDALLKEFGERTGQDVSGVTWDDGKVTINDIPYSEEQLRMALASLEAIDLAKEKIGELAPILTQLSNSANTTEQALADFLGNGLFDDSSMARVQNLQRYIDKFKESLGETDIDTLDKIDIGGATISKEDLEIYGFDTFSDFISGLETGIKNSQAEFEKIGEGISDELVDSFNTIVDDNPQLGTAGQKAVRGILEKAFQSQGEQGADFVQDFLEDIKGSDLNDAVQILNNVDWNTVSTEQLQKRLEDAGISVEDLSGKFPQLIAYLKQTQSTIDSMTERYNSLSGAAQAIKNEGIISAEQYQAIKDAGLNVDNFTTKLRDGTYVITGSAEEFYEYVMRGANLMHEQLQYNLDQQQAAQMRVVQNHDAYQSWGPSVEGDDYFTDYLATSAYGYTFSKMQEQVDFIKAIGPEVIGIDETLLSALENGSATREQCEQVASALQGASEYADDFSQIMEGTAKEIENLKISEILSEAKEEGIDPKDVKETAEQIKELAEDGLGGFSEELANSDANLMEVAKDLHKFGQAATQVTENYDDWTKSIKNLEKAKKDGTIISSEDVENLEAAKEALADMLDIDVTSFPEGFELTADRLNLMKQAAEGSTEAMATLEEQLKEAQMQEIGDILTVKINSGEIGSEILQVYDQLDTLLNSQEIREIPIGVGLDPTVHGDLYAGLNEILNACYDTASEAEGALSAMGWDAEVVPVEAEQTETQESTGWEYEPVPMPLDGGITFNGSGSGLIGSMLGGLSGSFSIKQSGEIYGAQAKPITESETNTKETKGAALAIKPGSLAKKVGGNVKVGNGKKLNTGTSPKNNGGGGGSTPKHTPKKAARRTSMTDRYSTVKTSIDDVARDIEKFSKAADDAWGGNKVRNMQKINNELQKQAKNLKNLRKLTLQYLETDKKDAKMARLNLFKDLGREKLPGLNLDEVLFNNDGFVKNRTELTQQLDNYLKPLYDAYYNAAVEYDRKDSTDENEAKKVDELKEKYDTAKAFVDEFLAALDLVDETAQEAADALEQQLENIREWMANKVEEATYKMEFQIGINERDISLIEQAIELWGDLGTMMGKTFDQLGKQMREEAENFNLTLEHGNRMIEIINNINPSNANRDWFINEFGKEAWNKYITGNGGLPAEVLEAMQDDADSMIEYMNSMYDIAEEMFGQYIEVLNMYMDEFDKIADKISANNDRLEMFAELLEFSGKKWTSDGRDAIRSIADATVDNAQLEVERAASALELAKQGAEETTAQLEEFYAAHGRDAEGYNDTEAFVYNQLKAAKDEADALLADAQSDMTSSIQDLASAAAEAIEMVAEVIKDEVVENLGGDFASFEDMTSMYDQQYDLDTFFLRDFDKEYQLNSLLGDIDDQMENITDPGRLKEYEALIEEINAANQEGVDLTQTDVDLLKAKFEIQKAQDAYEEAQNAKNTMRLARDASGNWNYVYSSDQSETDDAAQALADAQYNYEKLLWEASDEASQYWLQAQQEFFQFQETIDWARYEHDADYKRMIDQQLAYYQQKTELYANQIIKYNGMLDVAFEDTTLGVITNCKDMNSAQEWYTTQHTKYTNDLKQNTKDYQGQVEETCNQVGIKYDELEETVKTETELMGKENDALREKIKNLNTEGSRALTKLNEKVRNFRESFIDHMEACQKKLEAFLNTLKQMENASINEMYNTGFDAGTDYTAKIHNYIGQKLEEGYTEEQLLADEELKSLVTELKNKLGSEELYYAGHGTVKDRWGQQGWDFVDKYLQSAVDEAMDYFLSGNFEIWDTVDEWVQKHPNWRELAQQNWGKPPETATGGLIRTPQIRSVAEDGAELILNSEDTKNILSAVAHMRDVVRMKMSSINGTLGKQTSGVIDKTIVNKDIQQIEQQVHIDATFPNVSVASEIEEAFSNLVNQAVQYVSQKNHQ